MIVKSAIVVCPFCDEIITLDMDDVRIETYQEDILLSFKCPECDEFIDREAIERE